MAVSWTDRPQWTVRRQLSVPGLSWVRSAHRLSGLHRRSSQHPRRILGDPCRGIPPRPGGKVNGVDLAEGTWVQVNSGPRRCARGELLRYTDETTMAYVRIAISPARSAILVVPSDTITPAQTPMRASEIR